MEETPRGLQSATKLADCNFPDDIRLKLGAQIWSALDNPIRREVIRLLNRGVPLGAQELASHLGIQQADVAYHLNVLVDSGAIAAKPDQHGSPRRIRQVFTSAIADNLQARFVLLAIQPTDREFMEETRHRRTSRVLRMLRVPGPFTTIRLGNRRDGRSEER